MTTLAWTALSGLLLAGALPHLDWGWLAWIGLVPFLRLFPLKNKRTAFAHGFTLGVFFLGVMAYWVAVFAAPILGPALSLLGWALVTAYQAFYLGVWAIGAQWLRERPNPWAFRLGVPALWAIVEWWRQSGPLGLSWGDLAYTQHLALPVLQLTKLTGIWGPAFLIVLGNVALVEVWQGTRAEKRAEASPAPTVSSQTPAPQNWSSQERSGLKGGGAFPLLTALLVAATLILGTLTLRSEHLRPTFTAAALQGNIDQNVTQNAAYESRVQRTFAAQTETAAARGAALTVWPETAYPGYLRSAVSIPAHGAAVIGGIDYDWGSRKNANALFLRNSLGQVTGSYWKRQLVPFGEFVPGRRWLPFLEALHVTVFDMQAGAETQALLDGGPGIGKIGTVICFESSYPRLTREQVARGAGLLVISTDDTWFGRTAAARQHSAMAAVRAAETDRYLVRSAATGVSQIVDPTGRVLAEAGLYKAAVVSAPVQSRSTRTPYVRWGDWFVGVCALLLVGVSLLNARVRRAGTSHSSAR